MRETKMTNVPETRRTTAVFTGFDRRRRAAGVRDKTSYTGFTECRNMSSEEYPCAATRRRRVETLRVYDGPEQAAKGAEIAYTPAAILDAVMLGDKLAYLLADGSVTCGERRWQNGAGLTAGRLYPFGHGLYSPANNLYIPDAGSEKAFFADAAVAACWSIACTDGNGADIPAAEQPPASPEEGDYWYRTGEAPGLYRYDGQDWQAWPDYYRRLRPTYAGSGDPARDAMELAAAEAYLLTLREGDVVRVTDDDDATRDLGFIKVEKVITDAGNGCFVVKTVCEPVEKRRLHVRRAAPRFDFAVTHDNRVWACRFGENAEGQFVNEIYACRRGDPTNWQSFQGTADDSFAATVGEEGAWTGAAVVGDHPVFFKEHCFYTVYGDAPDNYRIQVTRAAGIAAGSARSAAAVGGALYYLSPHGVMRLSDGSLPVSASDDLMYKNVLRDGIGGADGRKYYLQARSAQGDGPLLYVYDALTRVWQIEDPAENAVALVPFDNELLAVGSETDPVLAPACRARHVYVSPPGGKELRSGAVYLCFPEPSSGALVWPDDTDYYPQGFMAATKDAAKEEGPVTWSFATGDFGHEDPDYKRVKSVAVRAWREKGASLSTQIMYDEDGRWLALAGSEPVEDDKTGVTRIEYRLRRCGVYRLRFSGTGRVCVYSVAHLYETAGDGSYGG